MNKIYWKFPEYISSFEWLKNNLDDDKVRIYGFLAERFMPYWFKSRYKVCENKICYFDTHLAR